MFLDGNLKPAATMALRKASYWLAPRHATSPVDSIPDTIRGFEFFKRANENVGTLHAT